MKINIIKGYFCRCLFAVNSFLIVLPIMGIIFLILSNDFIVFWTLVAIYSVLLTFSIFLTLIFSKKKCEYTHIYFYNDHYSLVNKNGSFIDFDDSIIYVDNAIIGILVSPYHLIFEYEIKYDFVIMDKKIEYARIYLTIIEYIKIKRLHYNYIKM